MIGENRANFSTVLLCVPVEQGLPQGYKGVSVISLTLSYQHVWLERDFMYCDMILPWKYFDIMVTFKMAALILFETVTSPNF